MNYQRIHEIQLQRERLVRRVFQVRPVTLRTRIVGGLNRLWLRVRRIGL
jgi:hypothetical protein